MNGFITDKGKTMFGLSLFLVKEANHVIALLSLCHTFQELDLLSVVLNTHFCKYAFIQVPYDIIQSNLLLLTQIKVIPNEF